MLTSCFWVLVFIFFQSLQAQIPAEIRISSQEIEQFCGTQNVKLVFTYEHKIYYADFSESTPIIHTINQAVDAAIPVISPDGSAIVYATETKSDASTSTPSTAWYCPLSEDGIPVRVSSEHEGFVPRFIHSSLDTHKVLYATCASALPDSAYAWQGCGRMIVKNIISGQPETHEKVLYDRGSYLGGLSWDGRYMGTAENETNAHIIDLHSPGKPPVALHNLEINYNGEWRVFSFQACNPSISTSRTMTDMLMYLDFGIDYIFQGKHKLDGDWTFHSRLFIAGYDGNLIRYYDVPAALTPNLHADSLGMGEIVERQWSHSEWSNHPWYAVAGVRNSRRWKDTRSGMYMPIAKTEAISIINLKDSTYLTVVSGTDSSRENATNLLFPGLWISVPDDYVDSEPWLAADKKFIANKISPLLKIFQSRSGLSIFSEKPLSALYIHNALGRLIKQIDAHDRRYTFIQNINSPDGLLFIKAVTSSGTGTTIKWCIHN